MPRHTTQGVKNSLLIRLTRNVAGARKTAQVQVAHRPHLPMNSCTNPISEIPAAAWEAELWRNRISRKNSGGAGKAVIERAPN
jgi:hypothetical protein